MRAARQLGVSQPRVSDVVRGRFERFTIDALVEMLARAGVRLDIVPLARSGRGRRAPVRLPTFRGEGMQPGVSLDDMSAVHDRMDGLRR